MSRPVRCFAGVVACIIGCGPVVDVYAQNFNRSQQQPTRGDGVGRPPSGNDGGRPDRPNRPPFRGGGFGIVIDPGIFVEPRLPPPPRGQRPIFEDEYDEPPPRRVRQPRPRPQPVVAQPRRFQQQPVRVVEPRAPVPRAPRPQPIIASPRAPIIVPLASEQRLVEREVLVQLRDGLSEQQVNNLFRRQRLERLESQRIALIGITLHRLRIPDQRSPRDVLRGLGGEARIALAQPNYVYRLEQPAADAEPAGLPPATANSSPAEPVALAPAIAAIPPVAATPQRLPQYSIDKLELAEVHRQSRGARVKIAVIDSGIDTAHPELQGALDKAGDMLTGAPAALADADNHGTGMASALFARSQLMGVAPAASLLAARAFKGTTGNDRSGNDRSGAQGTSWHVLKGIDWSVAEGARVLNLSFAGPRDELVSRALAVASQRGVVAVAAVGNAGPTAAPLFPASDPNVIAVTALDANDKVFAMANRGRHIAVAAPGVDVLVAQTSAGYGTTTGTSVATAHVSGLVALLIEQDARLDVTQVRSLLTSTAKDLGAPGPDAEFGAGMINIRGALARMPASR